MTRQTRSHTSRLPDGHEDHEADQEGGWVPVQRLRRHGASVLHREVSACLRRKCSMRQDCGRQDCRRLRWQHDHTPQRLDAHALRRTKSQQVKG